MRFTTEEVAEATGGEVFGRPTEVDGVSIDSRVVRPGELFVPVVAERDGHDFIADAVRAGVAAYFTSGPIEAATAIRVADTTAALQALGTHARSRLPERVVGITGSVGKTSVKDLLAAAAGRTWATTASVGSFNNELGVPLTLVNAPDGTECAVVEMGARGIGHVAMLCGMARPTVGVVTVVAEAHLEFFGSLDAVAEGKGELIAALPADGTAVLNADDDRVAAMAPRSAAAVLTFGVVRPADVTASDITIDDDLCPSFTMRTPWGSVGVRLGVAGRHQVTNALAAASAALAMGAPLDVVAAGLAEGHLSANRMDLRRAPNGLRVLNDAYNANPTSMRAALDALAQLPGRRRIAVLGTMAELGAGSELEHRHLADHARGRTIELVTVAEPTYGVNGDAACGDRSAAIAHLASLGLGNGDVVLVKASRSAGLEEVVAALLAPVP